MRLSPTTMLPSVGFLLPLTGGGPCRIGLFALQQRRSIAVR